MAWKLSGEKIKKLRLEKGLRQHHMFLQFGINQAQLKKIEEGVYENPGVKVICKICDALDVSPTQLFVNE